MGKYNVERKCIVEGCNKKHWGKGYCQRHLAQVKKYGHVKEPIKYEPICKVENCDGKHFQKGYCQKHFTQIRTHGKIKKTIKHGSICSVDGCERIHKGHGYCEMHLRRVKKYGHVARTMYDPNTFDFKDGICMIGLFEKYGKKVGEAIIDAQDYDKVKNRKWYLKKGNSGCYVASGSGENYIRLSRLIMDAKSGEEVDHEDHNLLNNSRSNLRICTKSQNQFNSLFRKDNTSGAKGVYFCNTTKRWKVTINKNNMVHRIGAFKTFAEAEAAANEARRDLHGKFAHNG